MTMSHEQIDAELGVKRLIGLYATQLDSRNLDKALALFATDASIVVNGEAKVGHSAIKDWFEMLANSPPGIHLTTNTLVDFDHDQPGLASARSDVAFIRKLEDGWFVVAAGRYVDKFELLAGSWLFSSRTIDID